MLKKILLLSATVVVAACAPRLIEGGRERTITVLHTNDFHGRHQPMGVSPGNATAQTGDPGREAQSFERSGRVGGFAALATAVERFRQARGAGNVLLLHGGDTFSDDLLGNLTRGEAIIRLMNAVGYDFMALGNHDFDYGSERTRELQALARFPMRGANVIERGTGAPFLGEPTRVFDLQGIRVGVLALGYHNTAKTGSSDNVSALEFTDGLHAAQNYVPQLRGQADLVVVLSHQGTKVDRELARRVAGIDLIVAAHSHDHTDQPERVGNTWIAQASSDAAALGELRLTLAGKRLSKVEGAMHTLWNDRFTPHRPTAELIDQLRAPHRARLEEVIGHASARIGRRYKSESPFDVLAGDFLRDHAKAQIAFLPGVGYGVSIEPGPVTREQLHALLPHPSKVVTMKLSGRQIREVLEQSAINQAPAEPSAGVGGLIQTAGLSWAADLRRPAGRRVTQVRVGASPLDDAASYRVVTHSGMLAGIHNYSTFKSGQDIRPEEQEVTQVVEAGLRAHSPVAPPALGHVTLTRTD